MKSIANEKSPKIPPCVVNYKGEMPHDRLSYMQARTADYINMLKRRLEINWAAGLMREYFNIKKELDIQYSRMRSLQELKCEIINYRGPNKN